MADPLLRNGHALILSSALTQLIGLIFWALATHYYSDAAVGRSNAALSAMAFLSGFSQLNLMSTLVRFLPVAGRRSRRLVITVYATTASVAGVAATVFIMVVPQVEPGLSFLRANAWLAGWFVVSIMVAGIFTLQDSALTGVRAAPAVPVENAAFAVLKLGLVVALAGTAPTSGIFIAWTAAMAASIGPTNYYLLRRALPRHLRAANPPETPSSFADLRSYMIPDFIASIFLMASTSLMPLVVLGRLGARANGYFALAWIIGYALYLVSFNMGASLVVETATDLASIRRRAVRVIAHVERLLVPAVAVIVIGAPQILSIFGRSYSAGASTVLRLLALSALPAAVTNTAIFAARSQRRMSTVIAIQVAICAGVFGAGSILMGPLGVAGVGWAWLLAQSLVAVVLSARPSLWLPAATAVDLRRTGSS